MRDRGERRETSTLQRPPFRGPSARPSLCKPVQLSACSRGLETWKSRIPSSCLSCFQCFFIYSACIFFFEKNKIFPHEKLIYISYSGARKMRKSIHTHKDRHLCFLPRASNLEWMRHVPECVSVQACHLCSAHRPLCLLVFLSLHPPAHIYWRSLSAAGAFILIYIHM